MVAQRKAMQPPPAGSWEGTTPIKLMIAQVHEPRASAWVKQRRFELVEEFASRTGARAGFDHEHAAELQALAELAAHRTQGMTLDRVNANALAALKVAAAAARAKLGISEAPAA